MGFWQRAAVNALTFVALAGFFPNIFHVGSLWMAFVAAVILGILNMFVKPFLVLISLPITFFTLGFFYWVINAFMLEMTSTFVGNAFQFANFSSALIVAMILSVVNLIITNFLAD